MDALSKRSVVSGIATDTTSASLSVYVQKRAKT
jgi:hypothetical protein